jgi:hypothetical protein
MNYIVGGGLIAAAGTSIIGSIGSGVAVGGYSLASYLWYGSQTNVYIKEYHRRLTKLDIPEKLKLVDALLDGEGEKKKTAVILEASIRDTYKKIQESLERIERELREHELKWFSSYRNVDCEEAIKDLETLVDILDRRLMIIA